MIIKKKRKDVHEEPVQKKKKVKTVIEIEEDVKTVIKTQDSGRLKKKKKSRKKENLKDECLHKLQPRNHKKKKKKKAGSELLREDHLEGFVNRKGHLDLQLQEESEEQIKIFKKKKKKVHCHFSLEDNESSDVELSNHCTDGTKKNKLSFKKKRKNTALDLELDGELSKKKKKKYSFSLEDIQDSEQRQSTKVCKNTHKYTSQKTVFMGEDYDTGNAQNGGESCVRKKKNKKKDKSDCFLPLAAKEDCMHRVPGSPSALSDSRKRKKHNSWELTWTSREEEDKIKNFGCIKERKKKKKKAVSSSTCEDKQDCSHSIPDKHLPAQQEVELEEEELSGRKHRKNFKYNNEVSKKKKKKMKKKEKETTYSEVSSNTDSASKSQKVLLENNKNTESEMEQAECVTGDTVDGALCNSNPVLCDRKRNGRKKVPAQESAEEPGSKADEKKIKTEPPWNESVEHLDGVIIVKEKKGNCDEINIDKVRRQALQEEIDRESGKTKALSSKVAQETKLGQWSTATFKSSKEQNKFFRLLGGFKKGPVPIQSPSAIANKPNMALNQEGEEKLQQALKMEFDKAMDFKQHRGIGLGFQPNANKKGYIDKYASRSIKFED
ncbi:lysine-rich nucleolar protein 1 [Ammospiza caudacuta]|uniref:lysine-rich nucleolar protein 1 n=1 Tax=Ammospiza caudacuta TaxID=2857398 RepID=UPI002738294F|nr:lysine-rich nucleolar protein 1 [Ammospiza caudacuta]XP_058672007.1 lysine-rich nucleolar protein 1 [Ammospiza caudacuta]XP_058672008.1 lysine-rich nucleolar protein 1 [Ammospiza caudacuta]